jgi:hypothetical protein
MVVNKMLPRTIFSTAAKPIAPLPMCVPKSKLIVVLGKILGTFNGMKEGIIKNRSNRHTYFLAGHLVISSNRGEINKQFPLQHEGKRPPKIFFGRSVRNSKKV